jgi:hypothetical protein
MNSQDYRRTIRVAVAPQKVFEAITLHIGDWWTSEMEGATTAKGDQFTVRFGRTHKTLVISDLEHGRRVNGNALINI